MLRLAVLTKALTGGPRSPALLTAGLLALVPVLPATADQAPTRAMDPAWGEVIYDYYQGRSLQALTRLAVARERGGIRGHGDHPLLVEGGLMLSWGMTREARRLFEDTLNQQVSPLIRSQAWFYLGKVLYLEGGLSEATDTLGRVDSRRLQSDRPDLYEEQAYLLGQIRLAGGDTNLDDVFARLPADSLWRAYLNYNLAVVDLEQGRDDSAAERLQRLEQWLNARSGRRDDASQREYAALSDRVRLSRAILSYRQGNPEASRRQLAGIRPDSLFAEEAGLLGTLVADFAALPASESEVASAAGPALTRAISLERQGQTDAALAAYGDTAVLWQSRLDDIYASDSALTGDELMASLEFQGVGGQWLAGDTLAGFPDTLATDPWGRLRVRPASDAAAPDLLADLVATEYFQRRLKDLYELEQIDGLLVAGDQRLATFDTMLDTRRQQRAERIAQTRQSLESVSDQHWYERRSGYHEAMDDAEAREDGRFFMTAEQQALAERIARARERLATLPDNDTTAAQRRRLERAEAAFEWQLADQYSVNRWEARRALRGLDAALDELTERRARLDDLLATPAYQDDLADRVDTAHQQLRSLQSRLVAAREDAREDLLEQARRYQRLRQQEAEGFLLVARLAQARLADQQYRERLASLPQLGEADQPSEDVVGEEQRLNALLQSVIAHYRDLIPQLETLGRPDVLRAAEHRLADLLFTHAEAQYADTAADEFDEPQALYRRLIDERPADPANDRLWYQLARIHDLRAERAAQQQVLEELIARHPASGLRPEALFRRAEIVFSDGRYAEARAAYDAVLESTAQLDDERHQAFHTHALYMKGWSEFRLNDYPAALRSYSRVLDRLFPVTASPGELDRQHQTLVEDLFRVMGLSFSYLDGPDSVPALFADIGLRPWESLVYERYADLLLARQQYTDAIDVYQNFIQAHPDSEQAPHYHMRTVEILAEAGFADQIPAAQAAFVTGYGIRSAYWQQAPDTVRAFIREQLITLLPELGNRHYHLASEASTDQRRRSEYWQAATYYQDFVRTFPAHEQTPEILFLLAETWLAVDQRGEAIEAFEQVAYDHGDHERAAEAGYAALLIYEHPSLTGDSASPWIDLQQLSRVRFASRFPQDPRAEGVLYQAVQYEASAGNHREVIRLGDQLLAWEPLTDDTLALETRILQARSQYELSDYAAAETAFADVLRRLPAGDSRQAGLTDSLAASVYRQGEQLLEAGEPEAAVTEWLRVGVVAPGTELSARASYDAAGQLMAMEAWDDALVAMNDLRRQHPDHELSQQLSSRMALAYRETGQWQQAAAELTALAESSTDPDEQRETRYLAAELYDRAGDRGRAIDAYRAYANAWPEPADSYLEAANRLAELYQADGDPERRRYWLNRQVEAVDRAGAAASDRMTYLAAGAAMELAEEAGEDYRSIRLTLPLERSLRAKLDALDEAADGYQKAASYGYKGYTSRAGYRLAELYRELATDLMDSDLPPGLTELETMQYELLLEEEALPFEDDAIEIHEQNVRQSWDGVYDGWIRRSFDALGELLPARYQKPEQSGGVVHELD